jgi:hypothetical protein
VQQTHKYWQQSIIAPYQPDIFVHCWKTSTNNFEQSQIIQCIQDLYVPKAAVFATTPQYDVSSFTDRIWPHRITPQNQYSQFDGIKRSQLLRHAWEQQHNFRYDIVVRARFDWYLEHVTFEYNSAVNIAHTPTLDGHRFMYDQQPLVGINDQFAYGSSEIMLKYAQLVDNIHHLYHRCGVDFCGELLLKAHLYSLQIPVQQHVWNNGIVRMQGIFP